MARTQQTRRQMRKGSKEMTDDERKAAILVVYNKVGFPPDVDKGPMRLTQPRRRIRPNKSADFTAKDVIDIDSDDENHNDDEDKDDISQVT